MQDHASGFHESRGLDTHVLEQAVDLADKQMAREYGVSKADLDKLREEAKANFRAIVEGTPTPTPKAG